MAIVNPKIKTKVVHSLSKSAWNVIGEYPLGGKYKIARVPYLCIDNEKITDVNRAEALNHATFISYCFNHSDVICDITGLENKCNKM